MTTGLRRPQLQELTLAFAYLPLPAYTVLAISGHDRASFLHSFCTNDIQRLIAGMGCEAFVTDAKGHTIGFVSVLIDETKLWIWTVPDQADTLIAHWDRYCIREDVQFFDQTSNTRSVAIWGASVAEIASASGITHPWNHVGTDWSGVPVHIVRLPFHDPTACLALFPTSQQSDVSRYLCEWGAECVSREAYDLLRIENRFPEFGRDLTGENLPQEVHRNVEAIHFQKGCYLGQETVARIDALGHVNRLLLPLKLSDECKPGQSLAIEKDGAHRTVGTITSCAWSPRTHRFLALGYVRREWTSVGTQLQCGHAWAEVLASVT